MKTIIKTGGTSEKRGKYYGKRNLYEEVEFGNDYGYAMQVKREVET